MAFSTISARPFNLQFRKALVFVPSWRVSLPLCSFSSTTIQLSQQNAEPLYRYCKGGYHPVHLGDYLNNERYKILHKSGWGGYSTVWAARDTRVGRLARSNQPGYQHFMIMQDYFQIHGPNGTHNCLVTELLGPSVADYLNGCSGLTRLPEPLVKTIAKQTLTGLSFLHEHNIAHADLHTRNLAFTLPTSHEQDILQKLGEPETAPVQRTNRQPLESNFPTYLFIRAPNRPNPKSPFDTFLMTHPILISQMLEMTSDTLPHRWQEGWHAMHAPHLLVDNEEQSLQEWLEEVYFDGEKNQDLSKEDTKRVGRVIGSMLRLEPGDRASAESVLGDAWF
ncbi:hypothetical protein COCVIDRAFT_33148 [Bipolaris victoriae FI3]|uniref:non-specific serine/threonine protein kinase n=1 Tax=Bipolaris victoriae (strain FI3) TaxID=930091 RepID=W7EVV1_BIPV3|nr:hypothetical protein COCVIDRAFT_33148 [Bipolaris victoriae FI3]